MVKGFILLDKVKDINSFEEVSELELVSGNASRVYFQIVDANSFSECAETYRRVMPQCATLDVKVTFLDIDEEFTIERVATQAFADDKSIWYVNILETDQLAPNSMMVSIECDDKEETLVGLSELRFRATGKKTQFC